LSKLFSLLLEDYLLSEALEFNRQDAIALADGNYEKEQIAI